MNLNIVWDERDNLDNYSNIHISKPNYSELLDQVTDSGCKNIHVSEHIYLLQHKNAMEVISRSVRKLRIGGRISISLVNFDLLSTDYTNGRISEEAVSSQIERVNCIIDYEWVIKEMLNNDIILQAIDNSEYYKILHGSR